MLDALYREQILEHWREPHHFGELADATHNAFLSNPLCGDEIGMQLCIANDHIQDIRFMGRGCAISMAATSMLTDVIHGKTLAETQQLTEQDIVALLGTTPNPSRMKCALLGLETLQRAVAKDGDT
ncbi:SUF system NifU family Fe-S cluster assembly protein [Candidatus Uhrbacteria bacterium]|nr:SUF system NifU family Fe-S cluster assembly protein [Candidatus Uhrbacteria bacterium]